jgi:hypothetical protein
MTTVKEGLHNYTHRKDVATTDTRIINLTVDKNTYKFKFSYNNYNANELFEGELFDGSKLNHVFSITDLGITRNTSAYHLLSEDELRTRIKMLTEAGIKFIKSLY